MDMLQNGIKITSAENFEQQKAVMSERLKAKYHVGATYTSVQPEITYSTSAANHVHCSTKHAKSKP
jgi:hypothetical protein